MIQKIKAYGGEMKVETSEALPPARTDHSGGDEPVGRGEGAEFIIQLPTNKYYGTSKPASCYQPQLHSYWLNGAILFA